MPADSTSPLATFTDRRTLHYDRRYPHPIDLVWEAVSTPAHLDVWLLPVCEVERRAGGRCSFTWGGPADEGGSDVGTVTVFDPPNAIEYTMNDGFMVVGRPVSVTSARRSASPATATRRAARPAQPDCGPAS